MASFIFNNMLKFLVTGQLNFSTDTYKVLLTTSSYTADKDAHDFRNDVTNEVTGTGYTAGGNTVTATVSALDTANDRQEIIMGGTTWPSSTITARNAVYYKSRGGASSADELIFINDFGSDVSTTAGTFTLNSSTLRNQN
jgi:hypothetical protein